MQKKDLDYFGGKPPEDLYSTAARLDYHFGTYVGSARTLHLLGLGKDQDKRQLFDKPKGEFIKNLGSAITENLPEYGGITNHHLREIVSEARRDWSEIETIMSLYRIYHRVTRTPYNEKTLFIPLPPLTIN